MPETRTIKEAYIYHDLAGAVGYENVSQDELVRKTYSGDAWLVHEDYIKKQWPLMLPDYVVWPETTEQVAEVVRIANKHKLAITPYCGGSGPAGAAIPMYGGITVDVKKLLKLSIDEHNLTVTCGTGYIGQELENLLNAKGFTYGHIPQSSYCSGIGGFISAGSAGMLSTKYGKVSDMVLGLEVVLPNAKIIRTKPAPRSAAGPNLNHLFIGSEGTMGIITEATLVIHPMPEERRFRGMVFPNLHSAFETARLLLRKGLRPAAMRVSDEKESKDFYGLEGSLFLFAFDGFKELVDLEESTALKIAESMGGRDLGPEPGNRWWNHRFTLAYPKDPRINWLRVGSVWDTAGSFDQMELIHKEMGKAVSKYKGMWYAAHFSHWYKSGAMMYPYVFLDAASEEEMVDLFFKVQRTVMEAILKVGGTINHHHGVGISHAPFMVNEFGASFDVLQSIKKTIDPNNIMNPGKLGLEGR
jgi:alkyldihydroxyacetonephosphate synthase